jgi:type VI protein secretion system component Hcp
MAIFLSLKADGTDVTGDVKIPESYADQISVQSLSFSYSGMVNRAGDQMSVSSRSASEASVATNQGPHSVLIWKALVENEPIEAVFTFDASDDGDTPEMTVTLREARIASTSFGFDGYNPLPQQGFSFSIAFSEIEIEHTESSMTHMDQLHTHA